MKKTSGYLLISLFFSVPFYPQTIDGQFITNISPPTYSVTITVNLQSGTGTAGVVQIEFIYNSEALDFPSSPVKSVDYILHGDFDLYVTQNVSKPDSNSVRLSLIALGNPPPVPIDTSQTLIITFYFTITNSQSTSNLVWTQSDIAPEFLQQNYEIGIWSNLDESLFNVTGIIEDAIPEDFNLFQNYPNPFNPSTTIRFSLPKETKLKINLYNMLGELVETIAEGNYEAGNYKINFNAGNLPSGRQGLTSGVYIYRIESNDFIQTKKMMLLR